MGFDETNAIINDRIHEIASKFSTDEITEKEKNELLERLERYEEKTSSNGGKQ